MEDQSSIQSLERQVALWLSSLRESSGVSQEALAIQLGKTQSIIAKMEGGTRKITVVEAFQWVSALGYDYKKIQELSVVFEKISIGKSLWRDQS